MELRAVKGMNDILPDESARWQRLERVFRETVEKYGYREVRTPMVEPTPLFVRSIGQATDIVEKEMYSFETHGEGLTLRPEGTAGVARAFIEHNVHAQEPLSRWYYLGPMFRAERPQRGRYRQFHQAGCEAFGDAGPAVDAEMIDMLVGLLGELGIPQVTAFVSSIGGRESRARHREALVPFFEARESQLSDDSKRRLRTNPLRIFDSKDQRDIDASAGAPSVLDFLDEADRAHFDTLKRHLERLGTPYAVDPRLVRGLDYYTRTAFELRSTAPGLGAQNAVGAGGRYDHMIHELGGAEVPAIGFALGLERLLLAMPETDELDAVPPVFVAPLGAEAIGDALVLGAELRRLGLAAIVDGRGVTLKAMLRRANGLGSRFALLLGSDEMARGVVTLKDLAQHSQEELPRAGVARVVADRAPIDPIGAA